MRLYEVLCVLFLVLAGATWADELIMSQNFSTHALVAKQIAPGSSRIIDITTGYGGCDSCNVTGHTTSTADDRKKHYTDDEISGMMFRIDLSLFTLTWPKTENTEGAFNYKGNTFGGGLFLNVHYAFLLEAGLTPTLVQWFGPFYIAAAYELSLGKYFGKDADEKMSTDLATDIMLTGALNVGGGTMMFLNNHGIGIGIHGGLRQMHFVRPDCEKYTGTDYRTGDKINPKAQQGFHTQDWLLYYGFDFTGYSNLPFLKETNSKGHGGYTISIESGIQLEDRPFYYWALTWSFYL
ncbi:MAG: hypothetical protein MJY78_08535 [Fibrobacter sp.]|nr:hypothetical protein [Fibrobacter sp.]